MAAPDALANQDAGLDHLAVLIECHDEAEAHARLLAEVTLNLISNDEWSAVDAGSAWTVRHSDGGPLTFEIDLPTPISVAGSRTRHIAMATTGFAAYLQSATPSQVARQLELALDREAGDDGWSKRIEFSDGVAGLRSRSMHAGAVMEGDGVAKRAAPSRVMVSCISEAEFDYE
jgi:hypothetical protein